MKENKSSKKRSIFQSIGGKILLIFISVVAVAILAVTVISVNRASSALMKNSFNQLEAVQMIKKTQIESYFEERMGDCSVIADSNDVKDSVRQLIRYHNEMDIGANEDFDMSSGKGGLTRSYDAIYKEIHSYLEKYAKGYGYADIFLMCQKHGHVMYTWAKETDLGTNLSAGQYRETHLADLWSAARNSTKTVMTDMKAYAPSKGAPAMFVGAPIIDKGERLGVFAIQIPLKAINFIMQQRDGMGKTGETYLVGPDKRMRSDSFLDPQDHSVAASLSGTVEKNGVDTEAVREGLNGKDGQKVIFDYNGNPVLSAWDPIKIGDTDWVIIAEIDEAEVEEPINQLSYMVIIMALVILGIAAVVAVLFSRRISNPLVAVAEMADFIADGDLTQEDLVIKTKDEIGALAESFTAMKGVLKDKADILEKVAGGDMTVEIELASDKDTLGKSLIKMKDSLNDSLGQVNASVEQVSSGSAQVSSASQSLSQGASEQASSLEEITSSITEINSQAKQNADNATEANGIAKQSMDNAENGNRQMKELVGAMSGINQSAEDIKKIVKVIDDIAFQINLLALNANVEAARAGKYGKGFAVVAEEVRNLAGRSANSVQETNEMVEEAIKNTEAGNLLVEATATQLAEIVTGASKVTNLVEEIATASNEQAQGLDQINVGLGQVDQVTQSNTSSAEECASASEELASQSQQLKAMVQKFKLSQGNGKASAGAGMSSDMIQRLVSAEMAKQNVPQDHAAGIGKIALTVKDKDDPYTPNIDNGGDGNGNVEKKTPINPEEIIKLDDSDFGKF